MAFMGEPFESAAVSQTGLVEPVVPQFGFMDRERDGLKTRWPRVMALLTCLAMVLVVAHQGGTIDQQQSLIRLLWSDSKQLTQIQIKELNKQREKVYMTDPQYPSKDEKTPGGKPAPAPKAAPEPSPSPAKPFGTTVRTLWRT